MSVHNGGALRRCLKQRTKPLNEREDWKTTYNVKCPPRRIIGTLGFAAANFLKPSKIIYNQRKAENRGLVRRG